MTTRYTIHGELTADGKRIILVADGIAYRDEMNFVAQRLALLTPLIQPIDGVDALELTLSWPAVTQLAYEFGSTWRPGPRLTTWIHDEAARRVDNPGTALSVPVPAGKVPRPYQVEGALLVATVGSALITDEPGTGKTITTILGLRERLRDSGGPVVVIAPASVVDPWVEAWQAWAPDWHTVAWRGSPDRRKALVGAADVYVASYDTATRDIGLVSKPGPLLKMKPAGLVLDECHLIKAPNSKRSTSARRLAAKSGMVVALSGTPITHTPADLWPTLVALDSEAWPARERWVGRYCESLPGDYDEKVLGLSPLREPEFRTALLGQHRRVAKADVLDQLPPKVYSQRVVELPEEYRAAYDAMEEDMLASLPDSGELAAPSILTQLQRLQQLSSAAADVDIIYELDEETGLEVPKYHVTLRAPSWKVDALLEVLAERPDKQTVVFAPSKQLIQLAGTAAAEAGYRVGYIVGGQTPKQRTENVRAFQAGETNLICVTTQAGGVGITLTAASTGVFLQRPWSLVDATQAEDRLHRIGSEIHDSIEIVDIIAANTIDSRVRAVLREKAGQLADLVQDPRIVAELLGGKSAQRKKVAA